MGLSVKNGNHNFREITKEGNVLTYQSIQVTTEGNGVCTVKLNRPQVRNALGRQMREELKDFFTEVQNNKDVKVIVLTGEGNAFSAGGDLSAFGESLPYHDNKVTLDKTKKDKWGLPVLAIDCTFRDNETKMREAMKNVRI